MNVAITRTKRYPMNINKIKSIILFWKLDSKFKYPKDACT